ncbi:MAG TPA: hypothetical protein VFZ08_06220 [Terriglobia bacterium]|nr:hypothetical protein [Terriglobia bacterium]
MRRRNAITLFAAISFLFTTLAWGQGSYKAATGGAPTASAIPQPVQSLLEAQSVRFENAQGSPVCEIWWRKGIPAQASPASGGDILYGGLTMGEFVGVINFPSANKDFRGQAIKPGYYTLRYGLIPQDGNHMGVSSYRDFLLLTPIAKDANPSQNLSFNDLVKGSRLTTGTGHPAVLMLDPPSQDSSAKTPSVAQDDQGNWALHVNLDVKAGGADKQLPFAVVLVGQYQG